MKIIKTTTPDKIPPSRRSGGKYEKLRKPIGTLAPNETLVIELDYDTQGYTLRKKVKQWFSHGTYTVDSRKDDSGKILAYITYRK